MDVKLKVEYEKMKERIEEYEYLEEVGVCGLEEACSATYCCWP